MQFQTAEEAYEVMAQWKQRGTERQQDIVLVQFLTPG